MRGRSFELSQTGLQAWNVMVNRLDGWGGWLWRDMVKGDMEKIAHT